MNKYTVQEFGTMGTFYVMRNGVKYGRAFNCHADAVNRRDALTCLQDPSTKIRLDWSDRVKYPGD